MSKITTDYGLVYNTDGSLCVTKRTDIVPFPGITSYAVETETTNLIQNPNFGTGDFTSWSVTNTNYFEIDKGHLSAYSIKSLPNTTGSYLRVRQLFNTTIGQTYTISFWIKHSTDVTSNFRFYIFLQQPSVGNIATITSSFRDLQWHRITYTFTAQYDSYYLSLESSPSYTDGYSWITDIQVEQKPFASSFVNGYRREGRLAVEPEVLGFNPGIDDWVVSYRKYPIATDNDTLNYYNVSTFGNYNGNGYYFYWGKNINSNNFIIYARYNDGTAVSAVSSYFNPDDYFRHWHSEVMLRHGNTMEYWVDGALQCQLTLTKSISNYSNLGLSLGGYRSSYACNALFANIAYGLYTDQWTPEFIQEQAAMTQGYYVPPRKVIE